MINYIATYQKDAEQDVPDHLVTFLTFIQHSMDEYLEKFSAGSSPDFRIKEALMNALGKVNMTLLKITTMHEGLVELVAKHIIPELDSEQSIVKERAMITLARINRLPFSDEALVHISRKMLEAMSDHELPIRVAGACGLYLFLRKDTVKTALLGELPHMLTKYLEIMEDIDQEELVTALEELVQIFGEGIAPYSVDLATKLVENYKRMVQAADDDEEASYGEAGMAASSCVMAIKRIVNSVSTTAGLLEKIEPIVYPVILNTLKPQFIDICDESLEMASIMIYGEKKVSQQLASLFPHLLRIVVGTPTD